ncbi:MAG: FAD-binding protein, partial [Bacteroidota bacterium]
MKQVVELKMLPEEAANEQTVRAKALKKARIVDTDATDFQLLRRSIDARGSRPFIRIRASVSNEETAPEPTALSALQMVDDRPSVIVVGAGPAGYFAALELIELGWKPIVLDRGKVVKDRLGDLRAIQRYGQVNPNSNYCFGEGGAGTYSDGKLYTRSHKRGSIEKVLRLLVEHGAKTDILVDAHPHIGSNKLPRIVANMRASILEHGGEVLFGKKVTDFILHKD